VARAKKTVRRKTGTITLDSSRRTARRQSIGVSKLTVKLTQAAASLPDFVEPMKAKLVDSMRPGSWIYEIKFDGYRALALRGGNETRILSRNQKDLGKKCPIIGDSIAALDVQDVILSIELNKITAKACPFYNLPRPGSRVNRRAEMKRRIWVKPMVVCEVKFTEWTRDDWLRHAVFLGFAG
jgi:ATP-dependent DNA ligase